MFFKSAFENFAFLGCPPHWKNFTDKCYYFSVEKEIFEDAKLFCEDKSSHLVFINSREEQVGMSAAHLVGENYNLEISYTWKLHASQGVKEIKNSWSHKQGRLQFTGMDFIQGLEHVDHHDP